MSAVGSGGADPPGPSDAIELRGLRVLAHCGVGLEEREQPQPLEVDLDVACDLRAAGDSDDLTDTVDYAAVCAAVEQIAESKPVALLERFAQLVADVVLDNDRVDQVTVWVRKLRPPVPQQLTTSGVRVVRSRSQDDASSSASRRGAH